MGNQTEKELGRKTVQTVATIGAVGLDAAASFCEDEDLPKKAPAPSNTQPAQRRIQRNLARVRGDWEESKSCSVAASPSMENVSPPQKPAAPFTLKCKLARQCHAYLKDVIGIPDRDLDHQFTRCYCANCLRGGEAKLIESGWKLDQRKATFPYGWVKMGCSLPSPLMKVFRDEWHRAYHGTRAENVKAIVSAGSSGLLRPGHKTPDGVELQIRECHITPDQGTSEDEKKILVKFCKSRFVTPSLKYAELYSPPKRHMGGVYTIVLQIRIRPWKYFDILPSPPFPPGRQHTWGHEDAFFFDPLFPTECIEWWTPREHCIVTTGVLVKRVEG